MINPVKSFLTHGPHMALENAGISKLCTQFRLGFRYLGHSKRKAKFNYELYDLLEHPLPSPSISLLLKTEIVPFYRFRFFESLEKGYKE